MEQLEEFLQRKIRIAPAGTNKFEISFPMYKVEGGSYKIYLIAKDGKFYLSDEGSTYAELDSIFELEEPDIVKNLGAILRYYGCIKKGKDFMIECTPLDIHTKLSCFIQAMASMLTMKIFFS